MTPVSSNSDLPLVPEGEGQVVFFVGTSLFAFFLKIYIFFYCLISKDDLFCSVTKLGKVQPILLKNNFILHG